MAPATAASVVAFFARQLLKELRLVGGYEVLYGQVKAFMRERLFEGPPVDIDDANVLRNLSESAAAQRVFDSFKRAVNALTVHDAGSACIEDYIRLRDVRPFRTEDRAVAAGEEIAVQPDRRRAQRRRVRAALRQISGSCAGCGRVREELPGGGFQARLRERRWRSVELHSGFHRQEATTATS